LGTLRIWVSSVTLVWWQPVASRLVASLRRVTATRGANPVGEKRVRSLAKETCAFVVRCRSAPEGAEGEDSLDPALLDERSAGEGPRVFIQQSEGSLGAARAELEGGIAQETRLALE
jgi:hypothetical protein